ncbi:MAG: translation initiation factor IF-3 [Acidimicrobiaceae bacterium]|nr:translation initiation factor IF-3 [Acidimicrobiaceae bacterium]
MPRRLRDHEERKAIARTNDEPRVNSQIRAQRVRLVAQNGQQIGITSIAEALERAYNLGLDLVEVADQSNPPVCRIMDYGKFKYDAAQRAKESRKKSSVVSVKEMKYRPKIGKEDFDTKTRRVIKFLEEGHKVKVTVMFRGREMQYPKLGEDILQKIEVETEHAGRVEFHPRRDGRNLVMVLAPYPKGKRPKSKKPAAEA